MAKRKIVRIDEEKCTGCGLCIPNCAEGALQIVDGKARLITDKFCDGLGACLGHCPEDAITIIEREAEEFDEKAVEAHLHQQREATQPHQHQQEHQFGGCPSSKVLQFKAPQSGVDSSPKESSVSQLTHWPVQLKLVPVEAPYFQDADLLVAADCVPFAYPDFHKDFLKGKALVVGCPKLDDIQFYREKLIAIFKANTIKSGTILFMEVPCCFGLVKVTEDAIKASGKPIPIKKVKIGIQGEVKYDEETGAFNQPPNFAHPH